MTDPKTLDVEATAVVVADEPAGIVRAAPGSISDALVEYLGIQKTLDAAMPDSIMEIRGKRFRKKSYWRAISTTFNLSCERVAEERIELDDDWGYEVIYRATAPNGRWSDGDGTCMASEKAPTQRTLHNVRAHAQTRAMNRAISNLVGFGEVSAEEILHEPAAPPKPQGPPAESVRKGGNPPTHDDEPQSGARLTSNPPTRPELQSGVLPWLDEQLGFGRHASSTWRHVMLEYPDYLRWLADSTPKNDAQEEAKQRAQALLAGLEGPDGAELF